MYGYLVFRIYFYVACYYGVTWLCIAWLSLLVLPHNSSLFPDPDTQTTNGVHIVPSPRYFSWRGITLHQVATAWTHCINLPLHLTALLTAYYYRNHASLVDTALLVTSVGLIAVLLKTTESSGMWCYSSSKQFSTFHTLQCLQHIGQAVQNCLTLKAKALVSSEMSRHYPLTDTVSCLSGHDHHWCRPSVLQPQDINWGHKLGHWLMFCFYCRFYLRRSHGSRRWVVFLEGEYVWIHTEKQKLQVWIN